MDSWTLCEVLGREEGNSLMRAHWESWITEDHIKAMKDREVEIIRLPIGDWTLKQYGPYEGCMNGAEDYIQWFLDTAQKYDIKVLLDVHAVKGSQNGFDNSGQANRVIWSDDYNFDHWDNALGEWMGPWTDSTSSYDYINLARIDWALDTVEGLLNKWGDHPALYALEPVNEPWWSSDLDLLKGFYRKVYAMIQEKAPDVIFTFHDAFHGDADTWNNMFTEDESVEGIVMDTHFYTAWWGSQDSIEGYCGGYEGTMSNLKNTMRYPVWVGEWSLATDVCAMWLGGFNDSNTEYQNTCEMVECPRSYLPEEFAVDFDREAAGPLGPFGSSKRSTIESGMCYNDSQYYSNKEVTRLGECAVQAFDNYVAGHFLWTMRNEIEAKWSYPQAYDNGWLNNSANQTQESFLQ